VLVHRDWPQSSGATSDIRFAARTRFYDAGELIRKHQPDVLRIEPFWKIRAYLLDQSSRDGKSAHSYSDRVTAIRTDLCGTVLQAGATGYWMKNGSEEELLRAVETVAAGKFYVSPLITLLLWRDLLTVRASHRILTC